MAFYTGEIDHSKYFLPFDEYGWDEELWGPYYE
jgi:hypothetical protein